MYSFPFLLFITLLDIIKTEYETIKFKYISNNFYIPIKFNNNQILDYFLFANILPISIFPSSKCKICKSSTINEKEDKSYSLIKENVLTSFYFYNFTGNLYKANITLGSRTDSIELLAFENITDINNYNGKGIFSLSFFNYYFNTSKKIFALYLDIKDGQLDFGGYNEEIIKNESYLTKFNVTKVYSQISDELLNSWYIEFNSIYLNDKKIQYDNNYKLTLDLSTDYFYIPKNFFFQNAHNIFNEDSQCQVQPQGYFLCICDNFYEQKYANFKFFNNNNEYFSISINDYIFLEETEKGSYCTILIKINYENDLFIAGKYVMNNYYTIFDIDNNQLKIYNLNKQIVYFSQTKGVLFLLLIFSVIIGLIINYICCKKNRLRHENNAENANVERNLIENNDEQENNERNERENNGQEPNEEINDIEMIVSNDNNIINDDDYENDQNN